MPYPTAVAEMEARVAAIQAGTAFFFRWRGVCAGTPGLLYIAPAKRFGPITATCARPVVPLPGLRDPARRGNTPITDRPRVAYAMLGPQHTRSRRARLCGTSGGLGDRRRWPQFNLTADAPRPRRASGFRAREILPAAGRLPARGQDRRHRRAASGNGLLFMGLPSMSSPTSVNFDGILSSAGIEVSSGVTSAVRFRVAGDLWPILDVALKAQGFTNVFRGLGP